MSIKEQINSAAQLCDKVAAGINTECQIIWLSRNVQDIALEKTN